ncbi:MAG TPA: tricarballylate utilization 4Fe-4S protein TcuB [Myxococcota bacterium]|nr:tricarballylate utilization 4Fe-4S protein TcuB [Myxococcota bacterium]
MRAADAPLLQPLDEPVDEGVRIMTICNACRYCEGYCAVFPAMERRLSFSEADIRYLANLCHSCGDCLYACQYAPPHAFGVNVPRTLARVRGETYRAYAWPAWLGEVLGRSGVLTALALAAVIAASLWVGVSSSRSEDLFHAVPGARFYSVIPHGVMFFVFGAVGLFVVATMFTGVLGAWSDMGEERTALADPMAWKTALGDAFSLRYLGGHATACTDELDRTASLRRAAHHLTFYGFLLCFAATTVAAVYHSAFGWEAPYDYLSLPVLLGTAGGVGLLIGPPLLYVCRRRADPLTLDSAQAGAGDALILLLFLTSATGLLLLVLRETSAMAILLVVHLAIVMALFIVLPYGKFAHSFYRLAALLRYALESRRPHRSADEA